MALSVAKPKKQQALKVVNNYGMQGSTVNPQPAAPGTVVQNTAPVQQHRATPAPAAPSAAAVQQAATAAQAAAVAEAARQREALRVQTQASISSKTAANRATLIVQASRATPSLTVARPARQPKIDVPDYRSDFEKQRDAAYLEAIGDVDKIRSPGKKSGFGKLWDKVTFGQDRRDASARSYAEKRLQDIGKKSISDYEKKLKSFLAEQARRRQLVESTKFDNQQAFDRAVADYDAWEKQNIAGLEGDRARLTGQATAYNAKAAAPLTSGIARAFAGAQKITKPAQSALGAVWKYTLGSGDKNIPSLVTAPSRVVNWLGNLNTPDRKIYLTGGKTTTRAASKLNAWQAGYGQRNFNIKPWIDIKPDSAKAHQLFDSQVQSLIDARTKNGHAPPTKSERDKIYKGFVEAYNQQHRQQNSALEFVADPLLAAGSTTKAVAKLAGADRAANFLKGAVTSTRAFKWAESTAGKLAETKAVKWLGAEAKSPTQRLADAIDVAKVAQGEAQKKFLPRINALNKKLAGDAKLDVSIFGDIEKLTDDEAKILQRMTDGKLTARDRLRLAGKGMAPVRARLENIAQRWTDFTEKMKLADQIGRTRFGRGKKLYSPRTAWIERKGKTLDAYNFRLRRKFKGQQTGRDFYQGAVHRYFKSSLDEMHAGEQIARRGRQAAERDELVRRYDELVDPARKEVETAYRKTRTPYGRLRGVMDRYGPTALWKKSVLKYRPAWYVNNALYNVQAATLAGGPRALLEHARLLRPRNFRAALSDVPDEVRTKLANEIGRGKLSKFGNNLENWSRVAAFRGAKAKGLSDAQALKRVNKYLLDYKTRNWERPLRAVVPFWSWQKGLTKAAVQMPFDRPLGAKVYNKVDDYQQEQFDRDFNKLVPQLQRLGYTSDEIEQMRTEQKKFFGGRLKVGKHYTTTPWNAFSEKGLSNFGVNPYLAAASEVSASTDSFGRKVSGEESSLFSRFIGKFPQAQIGKTGLAKLRRQSNVSSWIGAPGSEGYGMPKQAQGANPSKPSYQKGLDKGAKFWQELTAFAGVPSHLEFDKNIFLQRKTMQKLKDEYFSVDWKSLDFPTAEAKRNALFKKYGVSADQFYNGELAKYDTDTTKAIKKQKEDAQAKTKKLYEEYFRQPEGTRNVWATKKLKELVDSGYFATNPFLKTFKWTTPETIQKAYKKILYDKAKTTGDWSEYNRRFGMSAKMQKKLAYDEAKRTGNWAEYHRRYGTSDKAAKKFAYDEAKRTGNWDAYHAKYGVSDKAAKKVAYDKAKKSGDWTEFQAKFGTSDKAKRAQFWTQYATASPAQRKAMLAANPQYNDRQNWTAADWNKWRADDKAEKRQKAATIAGFSGRYAQNLFLNNQLAIPAVLKRTQAKRQKKIQFVLQ